MKKLVAVFMSAIMCIGLAGCKISDNKQAAGTPSTTPSDKPTQTATVSPEETQDATPSVSIAPILDLWDEDLILADSDFDNLAAPEGYKPSAEEKAELEQMVAYLRVTNDALKEIEQLKTEAPELLDIKAPIMTLMAGVKQAHDDGRALEASENLKDFHALYQSVLVINYNAADLMTSAMDGDDTNLADEAFALFERGRLQYDKLIDYANLLLGN